VFSKFGVSPPSWYRSAPGLQAAERVIPGKISSALGAGLLARPARVLTPTPLHPSPPVREHRIRVQRGVGDDRFERPAKSKSGVPRKERGRPIIQRMCEARDAYAHAGSQTTPALGKGWP
jgi:hypothetical protein